MFLVAIYAPALPIILYLYIVPESPRWLHTTGQIDKLLKVLNVQALRNGYELSKKSVAFLSKLELSQSLEECPASKHMPITAIFQHSVLYLRLMACSLLWALVTLTYYGISVKSTKFEDDDNKVRIDSFAFTSTDLLALFPPCQKNLLSTDLLAPIFILVFDLYYNCNGSNTGGNVYLRVPREYWPADSFIVYNDYNWNCVIPCRLHATTSFGIHSSYTFHWYDGTVINIYGDVCIYYRILANTTSNHIDKCLCNGWMCRINHRTTCNFIGKLKIECFPIDFDQF